MNSLSYPAGGIRGFTLLELLVVIAIIDLLAGYVAPRYFSQVGNVFCQIVHDSGPATGTPHEAAAALPH